MNYLRIGLLFALAALLNAASPWLLQRIAHLGGTETAIASTLWCLSLFLGFGWACSKVAEGTIFPSFTIQLLIGIVLHDAQVAQPTLTNQFEQGAHARFVHLAAQEHRIRQRLRDVGRGVSHAESDFQHHRLISPVLTPHGRPAHRGRAVGMNEFCAQRLQCTCLTRAGAARTLDEGTDFLGMGHVWWRGVFGSRHRAPDCREPAQR